MDDARSRLLDAAGPVFAEKGYQAATVREICQAAGVNIAAVNYYFGEKERLYIEAVKQASRTRAVQVPFPDWTEETAAETKLRDFVRTLLTRMMGSDRVPWQSRLMLREIMRPTSACRELAEEHFRPQFETLLAILDELLPQHTPPHTKRQVGYSVVGQCMFYRVAGDVVSMLTPQDELQQHFLPEQLAEHIAKFTLAALARPERFEARTTKKPFPNSSGVS